MTSLDATLTHRFQKGAVVALRLVGIFDRELAHCDHADAPHPLPLLRARRERPCCRRTAEQRYERAPLHSITSSARASTDDGISRPSALAVLRLMTNSYLVGACTGKSAGFRDSCCSWLAQSYLAA
jgi:hypothetical protein